MTEAWIVGVIKKFDICLSYTRVKKIDISLVCTGLKKVNIFLTSMRRENVDITKISSHRFWLGSVYYFTPTDKRKGQEVR